MSTQSKAQVEYPAIGARVELVKGDYVHRTATVVAITEGKGVTKYGRKHDGFRRMVVVDVDGGEVEHEWQWEGRTVKQKFLCKARPEVMVLPDSLVVL